MGFLSPNVKLILTLTGRNGLSEEGREDLGNKALYVRISIGTISEWEVKAFPFSSLEGQWANYL